MYRAIPKLVILAAIGALILYFYMTNRQTGPGAPEVIYVNPGFISPAPGPAR